MSKLSTAPKLEIRKLATLRNWLEQNHALVTGAWIIIYNKPHDYYFSYELLMNTLISYGWIDGVVNKVASNRHMVYISPRKPGSIWSPSNQARAEKLIAAQKMSEFGLQVVAIARANGSWSKLADTIIEPLPEDFKVALAADQVAQENFNSYTKLSRQYIILQINSAKQAATRKRRIAVAVQRAKQNLRY